MEQNNNNNENSIFAFIKSPYMKWIHMALYVLGFIGITLSLNEYANAPRGDKSLLYANVAILIFMILLWVMQGVKLLNWQSLAASVPFCVYAFFFLKTVLVPAWSNINHAIAVLTILEQWLLVMLFVDLIVTKRIRDNKGFVGWNFALLCVAAVLLLFNRNGRYMPVTFLVFVLMSFFTIKEKEWDMILDSILIAGVISFVITVVFVFIGSPFSKELGEFFVNVNDKGQYFGFNLALAAFAFIRWQKKFDWISAPTFTAGIWMLAAFILSFVKGGHTNMIGIALLALALIVLYPDDKKNWKKVLVRGGIAVGATALVSLILLVAAKSVFFKIFMAPYGNDIETRVMVFHQMLESAAWGGAPVANLEEDSAFIEFFRVHLVHLLYEYGYMAGGAGIIFMGCTWISSGVKYWKSRKEYYLLPALLGAMTLGVWCNNLSGLYYPMTFFCILSMYPVWVKFAGAKKKSESGKEQDKERKETAGSEEE